MFPAFQKVTEKMEADAREKWREVELKERELELKRVSCFVDLCLQAQDIKDPRAREMALAVARSVLTPKQPVPPPSPGPR